MNLEILTLVAVAAVLIQTSLLTYKTLRTVNLRHGDMLLDTSVLIDGRILSIAESGLLTSKLVVPQSVVRELQFMADRADHFKRERARFGLSMIEKLQQSKDVTLTVIDDGLTHEQGVDDQLIHLARKYGAKLCTIDYNLNKAARVQDIRVINVNELAHALRIIVLPGERVQVALLQAGQDKDQAVGYLDDGTMVVVDDAKNDIGSTIEVEITRALQTAAGRMVFAKRTSTALSKSNELAQTRNARPKRALPAKRTPAKRQSTDSHTSNQRRSRPSRRNSQEDALVKLANE